MNLITNGCSFTAGVPQDLDHTKNEFHRTNIGDFHCYTRTNSTAWPYQVQGPDKVYNLALGGSGNPRILRTTLALLDMASQEFIDDSVFVIQWSSIFRRENWCENGIQWEMHDQAPEHGEAVMPYSVVKPHDDDEFFNLQNDTRSKQADAMKTWSDYKFLGLSLDQKLYDSLLMITTLTHALESKGARYLYTALQWNNFGLNNDFYASPMDVDWEPNPYHLALYNLLPEDKSIKSVSEFLWRLEPDARNNDRKYYIKDDGHPNDEGNRLFANYVKEELENRNWLT